MTGGPADAARRRGDTVRQRLVTAAVEEIAERGWLGVTTRGVAAAAGVNPALVHYHFGSVENLRRAAARQAGEALSGGLGQLIGTADLPAGLVGVLRAMSESDPHDPGPRVLLEASLHATREPELGRLLGSQLGEFRGALAARVAQAVTNGQMRPTDPQATAIALAAFLDGIGLHWLIDPGLDLAAAGRALAALLTADPPEPGSAGPGATGPGGTRLGGPGTGPGTPDQRRKEEA